MSAREVPATKTATLYRGDGKWCRTRAAAYYRIARALVREKYEQRDASYRLLRTDQPYAYEGTSEDEGREFDGEARRKFIQRVARFLMFVDRSAGR